MKIFRNVFMVAAALMMGLASCNNEGPDTPDGPVIGSPDGAEIAVSFGFLRAVGDSQSEDPVTVQNGVVILTQGNAITAYQTVGAVTNASPDVVFTSVPASSHAWFVGNTTIPANLLEGNIQDLLNHMILLQHQAAYVAGGAPKEDTNQYVVNVVGSGVIEPTANVNANTGAVIHTATILVNPTLARVEMFNITGNQFVDAFTVEGIFIDTYFEEARVGGLPRIETLRVRGTGDDGTQNLFQGGAAGGFGTNWQGNAKTWGEGIVYDIGPWTSTLTESWTGEFYTATCPAVIAGTANEGDLVMADLHRVVPTANNPYHVWGYNLFANRTQTPRIAIRLSEIYINETITINVQPVPEITRIYVFDVAGTDNPGSGVGYYIYLPSTDPARPGYVRALWRETVEVSPGVYDIHYGHPLGNLNYFFTEVIPAIPGTTLTTTARLPHPDSREPTGVLAQTPEQIMEANPAFTPEQLLTALRNNREAMYQQDGTPLFISIRGFAGVNRDTGFNPRMVYQLGSYTHPANDNRDWYVDGGGDGAWTFGPEHVTRIPFERPIDVHVTIQLQPWVWVPVTPDLSGT